MKLKLISTFLSGFVFLLLGSLTALATILPPSPTMPTSVDDCKHNGWRVYGDTFRNQGDCVSFVATNGKNEPDGSLNY